MTEDPISITDYAYLAGLLDGEGWFGSAKSNNSYAPRIQIGMTNYDVLFWCHTRFGGHIHDMGSSRVGIKQAWKWNMSSNAIRTHIPHTLPFLKVKQQQGLLVVDWLTNWSNTHGQRLSEELRSKQEELWRSLKALNQGTH